MQESNAIGYLLQHLAATLARQTDTVLQERLSIGFSQYKILMSLWQNPNVQQRDIADTLGQTEASVSRQIKLLLAQKLLHTKIDTENRRRHITTLTPKGMDVVRRSLGVLSEHHEPVFAALSTTEQKTVLKCLIAMHDVACTRDSKSFCTHLTPRSLS